MKNKNTVKKWLKTGEVTNWVIREADFEGPIGVAKHAIKFRQPAEFKDESNAKQWGTMYETSRIVQVGQDVHDEDGNLMWQEGRVIAALIKARRVSHPASVIGRDFAQKWTFALRYMLLTNIIMVSAGTSSCQSMGAQLMTAEQKVALKKSTGMFGWRFSNRTYKNTKNTHQLQWYAWTYVEKHKHLVEMACEFAKDFWNVVCLFAPELANRHKVVCDHLYEDGSNKLIPPIPGTKWHSLFAKQQVRWGVTRSTCIPKLVLRTYNPHVVTHAWCPWIY